MWQILIVVLTVGFTAAVLAVGIGWTLHAKWEDQAQREWDERRREVERYHSNIR